MRAMILAAGRGERLRPLTDTVPKALVEIGGKPLIVHVIERLRDAGIRELVVNLAWLGGRIRERLGDGSDHGVQIRYSDEGDSALETAGGVVKALPLLGGEPFWVVNADILCDYPFGEVALAPDDLAHLVLVDNPDYREQGDFSIESGRLTRPNGIDYTFAGIGLYRPGFFAGQKPVRNPLLPLLQRWIAEDRISAEHYRGMWYDVGTRERLAAARALF
ncbi:MAG TPA: nucleotidyltransferase family protein [Gammaproteobacteria bacterium]|nr:nucleotidyltransferase family protein [Gammaproteobacteria bacterium]